MLGFLAGLGLRLIGSEKATHYIGPDHMTASAESVYVHANGHLFVTTHSGDTVQHLAPDVLQLKGDVSDMRMMPDGRLLIAERQPARIVLCDTGTWACEDSRLVLEQTFSNQFKVWPAADGTTLYATDSTRDGALYRLDLASGNIKPILQNELSYANDIQVDDDGVLWIADSGNRRIVHIRLDGDRAMITGFPFSARNQASFENRTWPMMLQALANGEWAVTQPTARGGTADILIYRDAQTPEVRLPLASHLDPTDLTIANGWLLASDIEGFSLYTLDPVSGDHAAWGDTEINSWLQQQKQQRDTYAGWTTGGMALMILCAPLMLVAGYLGTAKNRRNQAFNLQGPALLEPSPAEVPPLSSVYWLKREPKMDRLFRFLVPALLVLIFATLALLGAGLYLFSGRLEADRMDDMVMLTLFTSAVLVGLVPMVYLNIGVVRGQLGTDGQNIHVRYPNGRQYSAPANKIAYTRFLLRFGRHTVSVGTRAKQALYQPGEVETYIAPLLKHGKKIGALGLLARQFAAGELGQIYIWLYTFAAVAAVVYLEFGR